MSFATRLDQTAAVLAQVQAQNPNHAELLLHELNQKVRQAAGTLDLDPDSVPSLSLGNAIVPGNLFVPTGPIRSAQGFVDDVSALFYAGALVSTGTGKVTTGTSLSTGYYTGGNATVPSNALIQPPSAFVANMPKFALWESNVTFTPDASTTFIDQSIWKQFCDAVKNYGQGGVGTIPSVYAQGCSFTQAGIDAILAAFDASGINGGSLGLNNAGASPAGNNAPPSSTGAGHATSLRGKGWSVTTN